MPSGIFYRCLHQYPFQLIRFQLVVVTQPVNAGTVSRDLNGVIGDLVYQYQGKTGNLAASEHTSQKIGVKAD